jgi:hypothetical protein
MRSSSLALSELCDAGEQTVSVHFCITQIAFFRLLFHTFNYSILDWITNDADNGLLCPLQLPLAINKLHDCRKTKTHSRKIHIGWITRSCVNNRPGITTNRVFWTTRSRHWLFAVGGCVKIHHRQTWQTWSNLWIMVVNFVRSPKVWPYLITRDLQVLRVSSFPTDRRTEILVNTAAYCIDSGTESTSGTSIQQKIVRRRMWGRISWSCESLRHWKHSESL